MVPHRAALREPQLAEQLAEVPETAVLARGRGELGVQWCQVVERGGSIGGWLALAKSSGPAWRDSPPDQGGFLILGKAEAVVVVDVPVNMQLKIQQSSPIDSGRCLRIPFIDRVLVFPVLRARTVQTVQKIHPNQAARRAIGGAGGGYRCKGHAFTSCVRGSTSPHFLPHTVCAKPLGTPQEVHRQ